MSANEAQVSVVLDAILDTGISNPQPDDSVTLDILLSTVLPTYATRDSIHDDFIKKVFRAIQIIVTRSRSAVVDSLNYQAVLVSVVQFFNSTKYSAAVIESAYSAVVQMIHVVFSGKLRYEKYQSDITTYLTRYLDQHYEELFAALEDESFSRSTSDMVSELSVCCHILQMVLNFSSHGLNSIDLQQGLQLESFIRKQMFVMETFSQSLRDDPEYAPIMASLYSIMFESLYAYVFHTDYIRTDRLNMLCLNMSEFLNNPPLSLEEGAVAATITEVYLNSLLKCAEANCDSTFRELVAVKSWSYEYDSDSVYDLGLAVHRTQYSSSENPQFKNKYFRDLFDEIVVKLHPGHVSDVVDYKPTAQNANPQPTLYVTAAMFKSDVSAPVVSAEDRFRLLSLINSIGRYICIESGDIKDCYTVCPKCDAVMTDGVSIVDLVDTERIPSSSFNDVVSLLHQLYDTHESLLVEPVFSIAFLQTLRRLYLTYPILAEASSSNRFWKFIKTCFRSKSREVRLIAAKLFPFFLINPSPKEDNMDALMMELNSVSPGRNTDYLFEAVIVAWGELTMVTPVSDKLFIMLNPLIHFIGSANQFHFSKAFEVLELAASAKKLTPWQLLEPFIPYISLTVVQKLKSRPSFFAAFCDLIRVDPALFLKRTISYTVPYLIRSYKEDIIGEIAKRMGESRHNIIQTVFPKIFALLIYTEDVSDHQKLIKILGNASPVYKGIKWKVFIDGLDILPVVYEILILSRPGENDKVISKLRWLTSTKNEIRGTADDSDDSLGHHVLSVIQTISESINNVRGKTPYLTQVQNLRGLDTLIQLSGDQLVSCLPQILSCLQVGADQPGLIYHVLLCMLSLVEQLTEDPLIIISDTLVSFITQKYASFDSVCKEVAKKMIQLLFSDKKLGETKYQFVGHLFSLISVPDFLAMMKNAALIPQLSSSANVRYNLLSVLEGRCHSENKFVVLQTLEDLERYFDIYQTDHQNKCFSTKHHKTLITRLIDSIMNVSYKYRDSVPDIPKRCAAVLSGIGSLDSSRLTTSKRKVKSDVVIPLNCFEQTNEASEFVVNFINSVLVPAYWASEESTKQLLLAYTLQEYLKYLGLYNKDTSQLNDPKEEARILWTKFNKTSQTTLAPLLHSKYKVFRMKVQPAHLPIFKDGQPYSKWMKAFITELVRRINGGSLGSKYKHAAALTSCATEAIKDQDMAIPQYLLPYFCLMLVVADKNSSEDIQTEFMQILNTELSDDTHSSVADGLRSCFESVFSVLDFFRVWLSQRKRSRASSKEKMTTSSTAAEQRVEDFLRSMSFFMLAKRSSLANSYERSALYLEQFYRTEKIGDDYPSDDFFRSIQTVYSEIGDLDALDGVLKKFSNKTLSERLLQFEYSSDVSVKLGGLETLATFHDAETPIPAGTRTRFFKALSDHNYHDQLLEKLNSQVDFQNVSELLDRDKKDWAALALQSAVFTGNLNNINKWTFVTEQLFLTSSLSGFSFFVFNEMAKALICISNKNFNDCMQHLEMAQNHLGLSLRSTENSSPLRNKEILNLLHMLYDFGMLVKSKQTVTATIEVLKTRLLNTAIDFDNSFKIQSLQRVVLSLGDTGMSGTMWIESSKLARKSGKLDIATKAVMHAMLESAPEVDYEHAKLLWAQGEHSQAISLLRSYIDTSPTPEAQLKLAKWLDQSSNGSSSEIIREYLAACSLDKLSGKANYQLGRYFNKILDSQVEGGDKIRKSEKDFYGEFELNVVKHYMRAIQYSPRFLFETLPKVVTLWLDFSENYKDLTGLESYSKENIMSRRDHSYYGITKVLTNSLAVMPKYYWYSVLSQLISRILHPDPTTSSLIVKIVVALCQNYPEIVIWSVFSQYKSTAKNRQEKGEEVFEAVKQVECLVSSDLDNGRLISHALQFLEALSGTCRVEIAKRKTSADLKDDLLFQHSGNCLSLCIPLKTNFQLVVSNTQSTSRKGFPSETKIRFQGIDRHVQVLSSMQRPRRLFVRGSNGGRYSILCKPNDDLRKDARLMEFATVVDRLLMKDPESEKRNLQISSYAVVPLNEQMGIIEWVDGCTTLRHIWLSYLSSAGNPCDIGFCKKMLADDRTVEEKVRGFTKLLAKYPPVFHQWFLDQFPEPSLWYASRNNYVRSSAVMSIVGYLVGMGDRHGDNILISQASGHIMHVDFDCLFDKGLSLAVPERVPFRLTQNMVDACGITGYEGAFRKSSEVTNNLVRTNESTLMNVLESFLYDPIIDWMPKKHKSASKRKTQKNDRYYSQAALSTIRRKIRGILDIEEMPVSVERQVDAIILQATSQENLAQMYIGWMPFL